MSVTRNLSFGNVQDSFCNNTNKERHHVQSTTFDLIPTIAKNSIALFAALVVFEAGAVAFPSGEVTLPKIGR